MQAKLIRLVMASVLVVGICGCKSGWSSPFGKLWGGSKKPAGSQFARSSTPPAPTSYPNIPGPANPTLPSNHLPPYMANTQGNPTSTGPTANAGSVYPDRPVAYMSSAPAASNPTTSNMPAQAGPYGAYPGASGSSAPGAAPAYGVGAGYGAAPATPSAYSGYSGAGASSPPPTSSGAHFYPASTSTMSPTSAMSPATISNPHVGSPAGAAPPSSYGSAYAAAPSGNYASPASASLPTVSYPSTSTPGMASAPRYGTGSPYDAKPASGSSPTGAVAWNATNAAAPASPAAASPSPPANWSGTAPPNSYPVTTPSTPAMYEPGRTNYTPGNTGYNPPGVAPYTVPSTYPGASMTPAAAASPTPYGTGTPYNSTPSYRPGSVSSYNPSSTPSRTLASPSPASPPGSVVPASYEAPINAAKPGTNASGSVYKVPSSINDFAVNQNPGDTIQNFAFFVGMNR